MKEDLVIIVWLLNAVYRLCVCDDVYVLFAFIQGKQLTHTLSRLSQTLTLFAPSNTVSDVFETLAGWTELAFCW